MSQYALLIIVHLGNDGRIASCPSTALSNGSDFFGFLRGMDFWRWSSSLTSLALWLREVGLWRWSSSLTSLALFLAFVR